MNLIAEKFKFAERGTTIRTEIIAGLTTFFAMCYILFVNSGMFAEIPGVSFNAMYITTALSAVIGTLLMAFLTNLPLALAPGMGINAFFVYTCCLGFGFSYENALLIVLCAGIVFVILTITGLRGLIVDSVPNTIKAAISVGLGLFIVYCGLQSSKIIVADQATLTKLQSFNLLGGATLSSIMPAIITFITVLLICIFAYKKNKIGTFLAIIIGTVLYYILGSIIPGFKFGSLMHINILDAFREFFDISFLAVFKKGFDFTQYLSVDHNNMTTLILSFSTSVLAFCMLDMFDTLGTLYGTCKAANILYKDDKGVVRIPKVNEAMLSDASATVIAACLGTNGATTYMESAAGIGAGGKTGFSSIITALCFLVATFFVVLASFIPACAYSAALIYVGILMMGSVTDILWNDITEALPAFFTIVIVPFAYNITYGIAFGVVSFIFMKLLTGKYKEIPFVTYIIGLLFLVMFLFTH